MFKRIKSKLFPPKAPKPKTSKPIVTYTNVTEFQEVIREIGRFLDRICELYPTFSQFTIDTPKHSFTILCSERSTRASEIEAIDNKLKGGKKWKLSKKQEG